MTTSSLETDTKELIFSPGELVYVAGELFIITSVLGDTTTSLFAFPQLGLVVTATQNTLLLWFAEFGVNKEREHILACAPINRPTTKVWAATSALASPGAKDFLDV